MSSSCFYPFRLHAGRWTVIQKVNDLTEGYLRPDQVTRAPVTSRPPAATYEPLPTPLASRRLMVGIGGASDAGRDDAGGAGVPGEYGLGGASDAGRIGTGGASAAGRNGVGSTSVRRGSDVGTDGGRGKAI